MNYQRLGGVMKAIKAMIVMAIWLWLLAVLIDLFVQAIDVEMYVSDSDRAQHERILKGEH